MADLLLQAFARMESTGTILHKVTERELTNTTSLSSFDAAVNSLRSGVPTSAPTAGLENCTRRPNTDNSFFFEQQQQLVQLLLHSGQHKLPVAAAAPVWLASTSSPPLL